MPVKKKRKLPEADDNEQKCKITSFTRPQIRGARPITEKLFSIKKCLAWFNEYAGPDKVVGPEAMEKFCKDIGVEPENVSPGGRYPISPFSVTYIVEHMQQCE